MCAWCAGGNLTGVTLFVKRLVFKVVKLQLCMKQQAYLWKIKLPLSATAGMLPALCEHRWSVIQRTAASDINTRVPVKAVFYNYEGLL